MIELKNAVLFFGLSWCLNGCAKIEPTIPPSIFLQVREVEKPTINNLGDIQRSYIELFNAYQNNLLIIKSLEDMQK